MTGSLGAVVAVQRHIAPLGDKRPLRAISDGAALILSALLIGMSLVVAPVFAFVAWLLVSPVHGRAGLLQQRATPAFQIAARLSIVTLVTAEVVDGVEALRLWLLSTLTVVAGRILVSQIFRLIRTRSRAKPIAIVGAGQMALQVAQTFAERPEYGFRPVGFIDSVAGGDTLPLPLLGTSDDLERIIEEHELEHLLIAFGATRESELIRSVRTATGRGLTVFVMPRFFELTSEDRSADLLWGYPIQQIDPPAYRRSMWPAKRVFDVAVAASTLVLTAPLFGVLALLVKLSSPGPVIFRQTRVGLNGRAFELMKFRSMTVNEDADTTWSVETDQRVTTIGHVLRGTHLDELPQLVNVLRGDMSIVGPRPERPFFVDQFEHEVDGYAYRHDVPVGVTGLAQVNGLVGDTSIADRSRFDNLYIQSWKFSRDLSIIFRTLKTLVPTGAEGDDGGSDRTQDTTRLLSALTSESR